MSKVYLARVNGGNLSAHRAVSGAIQAIVKDARSRYVPEGDVREAVGRFEHDERRTVFLKGGNNSGLYYFIEEFELGAMNNETKEPFEFQFCMRQGCEQEAKWRVVLLVRPKSSNVFARGQTGLAVCDSHRERLPDKFITDEGWKAILEAFDRMGRARPHRILTEVTYDPIGGRPPEEGSMTEPVTQRELEAVLEDFSETDFPRRRGIVQRMWEELQALRAQKTQGRFAELLAEAKQKGVVMLLFRVYLHDEADLATRWSVEAVKVVAGKARRVARKLGPSGEAALAKCVANMGENPS